MTESKAFRLKRAQDNVVRLATEWSRANSAWLNAPSVTDEEQAREDELFATARQLHKRLDAACHELVAVEVEP